MNDPIKISSKVESSVWEELRELSKETHQSIAGMLTEAISDFVRKRRMRPEVLRHLEDSIEDLGGHPKAASCGHLKTGQL